jgi:ATP-dependent protease ClpP protease subunit
LACRSHIAIICYGEASSMGSIILQAADLRLAMPNCYFMIHCMSLGTEYCPIKSYKSYGDFSSKLNNNMLNIYVNRFYETGSFFKGKTKKYIRQYIENKLNSKLDWYLTAEEALNLGLIDGIIDNTHQIDKICKLN